MTDYLALALAEAKKATVPWSQWVKDCQNSDYNPVQAHWNKAGLALEQAAKAVPPPLPVSSAFAGKGLFTTWDPAAAFRGAAKATWVAVQLDTEGGGSATVEELRIAGFNKVFGWNARASLPGLQECIIRGCDGYIGQAETEAEAQACLALPAPPFPKALIGNAGAWSPDTFNRLAANGWDLIQEWYWNDKPWETAPNAFHYPRLVSVCFGLFKSASGRRVPLSDYLKVWGGSYSCYTSETMTDADWAVL